MKNQIIQEKYVAKVKNEDMILTMGGFKKYTNNVNLSLSQVRLFNSESEAITYVFTRYPNNCEIKKVVVTIDFVESDD